MTLESAWTSFLYSIFKHNRQEPEHKNWFVSFDSTMSFIMQKDKFYREIHKQLG